MGNCLPTTPRVRFTKEDELNRQDDSRSPLIQAIEKRERKAHHFRVNDFLGLPGPQIHHIAIRVATKEEEDAAVISAHEYVKNAAGQSDARTDADLLLDAKACHILHWVCREVDIDAPAFLGRDWMAKHFTTDHIACLLNLYREVRKKEGPQPKELDDSTAEAILTACASAIKAGEDIPAQVIANCNRETLSELILMAAVKLDVARDEATAANAQRAVMRREYERALAALKEHGIELNAEPAGATQ